MKFICTYIYINAYCKFIFIMLNKLNYWYMGVKTFVHMFQVASLKMNMHK